MSIYGSLPAPDNEHLEGCAKWVRDLKEAFEGMITERGTYGLDDSQPCTCGRPDTPLVYKGSHVLPSATDERGGWVDIACIAGFITRDGRDESAGDYDSPWPYLRFGVNEQTVVLTERNVRQIADTLNEWLALPKVKEERNVRNQ
jgi:hypothetical protein